MTAILRQRQDVAVGEPGELGCEAVALARRRGDGHGKAVIQNPGDLALDPADMVDIGDDPFANRSRLRGRYIATPPGDMLMTWQGYS